MNAWSIPVRMAGSHAAVRRNQGDDGIVRQSDQGTQAKLPVAETKQDVQEDDHSEKPIAIKASFLMSSEIVGPTFCELMRYSESN